MLQVFAISGLTLIIGLISLVHDFRKGRRTAIALGCALFLMFGVKIVFGYQSNQEKKTYRQRTEEYRRKAEEYRQEAEEYQQQTSTRIRFLVSVFGYTEERAETVSAEEVIQSFKAAESLQAQIQSTTQTDRNRRSQINVQYFAKGFDENIVEDVLTSLGFRPQRYRPEIENVPTNAIWAGENVPVEDVKAIANALLRAGVELQSVRSFPSTSADQRRNTIQIGSDLALYEDEGCQSLTYEQIQTVQVIDRDNLRCGN